MENLIKKFEKMQLNLAKRIELLSAQVENKRIIPRPYKRREYIAPIQPTQYNQPKTRICFKCSEIGHLAKNCMSERNFQQNSTYNKPKDKRINYITVEMSEEEETDEEMEIFIGQQERPKSYST